MIALKSELCENGPSKSNCQDLLAVLSFRCDLLKGRSEGRRGQEMLPQIKRINDEIKEQIPQYDTLSEAFLLCDVKRLNFD